MTGFVSPDFSFGSFPGGTGHTGLATPVGQLKIKKIFYYGITVLEESI